MNKEFIPYKQALELKELGFDEPCLAYYNVNNELTFTSIVSQNTNSFWLANPNNITSAPLYQQSFRWFRENGYISQITYDNFHNSHGYQIDGKYHTAEESFLEYESAEFTCLEKLIEIVKNK
jgi:hypothetical protein